MTKNPIFEIYERLAADIKWSKYMKDVKNYISPYQHSDNPIAEVTSYLSDCGFSHYKVYEKDRLYVYQTIDILRGMFLSINSSLMQNWNGLRERESHILIKVLGTAQN